MCTWDLSVLLLSAWPSCSCVQLSLLSCHQVCIKKLDARPAKCALHNLLHCQAGALLCKNVYARPRNWLVEIGILKIEPQNHGLFSFFSNSKSIWTMLITINLAKNELISQFSISSINKLVLKALAVLFSLREAVEVQLTTSKMYPQPPQHR